MSKLVAAGKAAGSVAAWLGVATAGAAVGIAAERYALGRSFRRHDPYAGEPFGSLRGRPQVVTAADGAALYVEVDEPTEATDLTVVFCHGYALTQDSWHFQRRDLRGRARLVFWDQRRHGRSGGMSSGSSGGAGPETTIGLDRSRRQPPQAVVREPHAMVREPHAMVREPQAVTWERLAADLAAVLDQAVPSGPVILVGHSMGGMTILALALEHPDLFGDRVRAVALVATSAEGLNSTTLGLPAPLGRLANRTAPALVTALARLPELVERGRRAGGDLGYVLTRRYSFTKGSSPALVEFTARMNSSTPVDVLAEFLPMVWGVDARDALPVLASMPVQVIAADQDHLVPVRHGREIADALAHAEYVEVRDAGHMILLERHDLVTGHLAALIDRVRRGIWRRGSRTKVKSLVDRT